jgi:GTP cyclohydrolase II
MNRLSFNGPPTGQPADAADSPDPVVAQLRRVHRTAAELRRGTPVLITGTAPLVVLAAEAAGGGLREFARLAGPNPMLLLAPIRAAAVVHRPMQQTEPVALRLSPALFAPDILAALADPTAEQIFPETPETVAAPALGGAALALAKLARLLPAVLAAPAIAGAEALAGSLGLLSVPAQDVLDYPAGTAAGLRKVAEASVPLEDAAEARVVAFRTADAAIEHLAIVIGDPLAAASPLVRIHSECFTGDLLGSLRCDCGSQLRGAIQRMSAEGSGVLLYLAQEGRGIGLVNKLRAYALQDRGLDTLDANRALGWGADERSFLIAATMLQTLGVDHVRLLTNNPDKIAALAACGIAVAGRESHLFAGNGVNDKYLATKITRFGHLPR